MILLPRHRLYRQPQGAVEVDWSNPLTRGLVLADTGSLFEAVSRSLMTITGATRLPSPRGMVYSFAANTRVETTVDKIVPPFTVACDVRRTGTWSGFGLALVSNGGSGSGGKGWVFTGVGTSKIRVTFGGVAVYSNSVGDVPLNEWTRIGLVVTANGGSAIYYIGGAEDSTRAVGTMGTPASRPVTFGASHNGSSWVDSIGLADVSNVSIWSRALSADEIAEENSNRHQIFRAPQRRLYVQVAGGTSTREVTAAGGFDLGGTSNLLRQVTRAASGGIDLGGTAAQARVVARVPSGGFDLGGVAAALRYRVSTGSGGIDLGGTAPAVGFRGITVEGDGGIAIGGEVIPLRYRTVSADGGIALGGTAAVSFVGGAITARVIRVVIPGGGVRSYTI